MFAFILLLALTEPRIDIRGATGDPVMFELLQDLAVRGENIIDDREVAAFIVAEPAGGYRCLVWPQRASRRSEKYDGAIPHGTVAIAHTHPYFAEQPSTGDVEQSKHLGLPIYVLSRWSVFAVDPVSGERVRLIQHRNWAPGSGRHVHCEERWSPAEMESRSR